MKTLGYIFIFSLFLIGALHAQESDKKEVFVVVEESPEFPGGREAMMKFISTNIKYPETCKENAIGGKVHLKFIVSENGDIESVELLKSSGAFLLDDEAIRVVKLMPKWKPGYQTGKAVRVYFNLPINFKLDGSSPFLVLKSENKNKLYAQACNLLMMGDTKGAIEVYQTCIGDTDAWFALAILYYKQGNNEKARHYLENVKSNIKDDKDPYLGMAKDYLAKYFGQQ